MSLKGLLALSLTGCLVTGSVIKGNSSPAGPPYGYCPVGEGIAKGYINDDHITEASGLAYSRLSSEVIWVNNDSGGKTRIFAVSEHGRKLAEVWLEGTTMRDWEDIAVNVEDGVSYIYLADTGDNGYSRSSLTIYKFKEPPVSHDGGEVFTIGRDDIEHIHIKYPDGQRFDCEAMAIDPLNHDILLFTKHHHSWVSDVFRVPHGSGDPKVLEFITPLPYKLVTGADISPSGDTLALTSVLSSEEGPGLGWSWSQPAGQTQAWAEVLRAASLEPCQLNLKQAPQREAITVTDSGYWTTSEHQGQPLYFYPKY